MKKKYKLFTFVLKTLNKIISKISKGSKKLVLTDANGLVTDYWEIKDFIYRPSRINYQNKILFIDKNYGNLQSIYSLIDNKYCTYISIKSDEDFDSIKKIYDYKIIVVNSDLRFLDKVSKKHQLVVCVWHALGAFKKVGKYNLLDFKNENEKNYYESFFDFLIVSSSDIVPLYSDAFNINKENVLPLGLPQIDKYFNKDDQKKSKEKFLQEFPFLKNKKIYGFFPTFQEKKYGTFWNIDFKKLASLLQDDEIIVFKLHPNVSISKTDFYEVKNKIINLSHIKDLIYLCPFDSIITDYSSIIFEAMIFNINLVFLRNKSMESERGLWIEYNNLPGNIIDVSNTNTKLNLEKIILENLRNKFTDKLSYEKFYYQNIGNCDSQSSQRIANFLLQKLKEIK